MTLRPLLLTALSALAFAAPAQAQWHHGGPMAGDPMRDDWDSRAPRADPSRGIGRVTVTRLRSAAAEGVLGKGPIAIAPGDPADSGMESGLPLYEAALQNQLARAGYDTQGSGSGQIAEITLSHAEIQPAEPPHKPVSGVASTYVSNRGSGFGLGLNIDLTKPKGPVIGTRLDVRIRDRASGAVLWEGHAETSARETAAGIDNGKTAAKLTEALFSGFPDNATVVAAR